MEEELRTEFLSDVNAEIDRLSAIVSDLLTLVHADAHTIKLSRNRMSFASVVKEVAHRLEPLISQREQELELNIQDSCDMYADRSKLEQVVYNLMENAVKYTHTGGKIKVSLYRDGREAKLTVKDDGAGISEENLKHIFERFYRVDRARSRETGGTGLGLSISKQMVTLHSGKIYAESEEGKGSTFTVILPLTTG
jgi:signal transduction histidine kinase